jgi:quinoprotein glucose dehydrogenase
MGRVPFIVSAVGAITFGFGPLAVSSHAQTAKTPSAFSETGQPDHKGWKVYGGTNDNIKYSALDQITPANISTLQVAWRYSSGQASDTNRTDMKTNPIVIDGILYGLNPQLRLFALDAATGKVKWVYDPISVPQKGKNIGRGDFATSTKINRGLAYYKGSATDQRILYAPGGGHAL